MIPKRKRSGLDKAVEDINKAKRPKLTQAPAGIHTSVPVALGARRISGHVNSAPTVAARTALAPPTTAVGKPAAPDPHLKQLITSNIWISKLAAAQRNSQQVQNKPPPTAATTAVVNAVVKAAKKSVSNQILRQIIEIKKTTVPVFVWPTQPTAASHNHAPGYVAPPDPPHVLIPWLAPLFCDTPTRVTLVRNLPVYIHTLEICVRSACISSVTVDMLQRIGCPVNTTPPSYFTLQAMRPDIMKMTHNGAPLLMHSNEYWLVSQESFTSTCLFAKVDGSVAMHLAEQDRIFHAMSTDRAAVLRRIRRRVYREGTCRRFQLSGNNTCADPRPYSVAGDLDSEYDEMEPCGSGSACHAILDCTKWNEYLLLCIFAMTARPVVDWLLSRHQALFSCTFDLSVRNRLRHASGILPRHDDPDDGTDDSSKAFQNLFQRKCDITGSDVESEEEEVQEERRYSGTKEKRGVMDTGSVSVNIPLNINSVNVDVDDVAFDETFSPEGDSRADCGAGSGVAPTLSVVWVPSFLAPTKECSVCTGLCENQLDVCLKTLQPCTLWEMAAAVRVHDARRDIVDCFFHRQSETRKDVQPNSSLVLGAVRLVCDILFMEEPWNALSRYNGSASGRLANNAAEASDMSRIATYARPTQTLDGTLALSHLHTLAWMNGILETILSRFCGLVYPTEEHVLALESNSSTDPRTGVGITLRELDLVQRMHVTATQVFSWKPCLVDWINLSRMTLWVQKPAGKLAVPISETPGLPAHLAAWAVITDNDTYAKHSSAPSSSHLPSSSPTGSASDSIFATPSDKAFAAVDARVNSLFQQLLVIPGAKEATASVTATAASIHALHAASSAEGVSNPCCRVFTALLMMAQRHHDLNTFGTLLACGPLCCTVTAAPEIRGISYHFCETIYNPPHLTVERVQWLWDDWGDASSTALNNVPPDPLCVSIDALLRSHGRLSWEHTRNGEVARIDASEHKYVTSDAARGASNTPSRYGPCKTVTSCPRSWSELQTWFAKDIGHTYSQQDILRPRLERHNQCSALNLHAQSGLMERSIAGAGAGAGAAGSVTIPGYSDVNEPGWAASVAAQTMHKIEHMEKLPYGSSKRFAHITGVLVKDAVTACEDTGRSVVPRVCARAVASLFLPSLWLAYLFRAEWTVCAINSVEGGDAEFVSQNYIKNILQDIRKAMRRAVCDWISCLYIIALARNTSPNIIASLTEGIAQLETEFCACMPLPAWCLVVQVRNA